MKTKEELNALKEEVETVSRKLHELTEEELAQVSGGGFLNYEYYTCVPGDTLQIVAAKFNTNSGFLITLNNLTDTRLYVNQRILVPKKYL